MIRTRTGGSAVTMELAFGHVRVTATPRGWVRASGQWASPDVLAVEVWNSDLLPEVELPVSSFETKRATEAEQNPLRDDVLLELIRLKLGLYTMYNTSADHA